VNFDPFGVQMFMRLNNQQPDPPLPKGTLWPTLCRDPQCREQLKAAEVILGVYPDGCQTIFFGEQILRQIVKQNAGLQLNVAKVPIRPETDDIEVLCAFCKSQKGSCDYRGSDYCGPIQ
jgi:hypothetical protein